MLFRLGILLLLYSAARFCFFLFNRAALENTPVAAITAAFLLGFRADLLAIVLSNSVLIALGFYARLVRRPWNEKFLNVVFLVFNLPLLVINVVDFEYFKFTGERSSLTLWDVRSDIPFQIGNFVSYYWPLALIAALFIFLACFFLPNGSRTRNTPARLNRVWSFAAASLLALLLLGNGVARRAPKDQGE
jgi:hypothetical protein